MTISPTQAAEFLAAHDRYLILTHAVSYTHLTLPTKA